MRHVVIWVFPSNLALRDAGWGNWGLGAEGGGLGFWFCSEITHKYCDCDMRSLVFYGSNLKSPTDTHKSEKVYLAPDGSHVLLTTMQFFGTTH